MSARARGRAAPLWGLVPVFVVELALFVVPLAIMGLYSFWTTQNFQIVTEWTLANYRAFFESWTYPTVLVRTLAIGRRHHRRDAGARVPAGVRARALREALARVLLAALILSFWTSGLLRAYAWMAVLGTAASSTRDCRRSG